MASYLMKGEDGNLYHPLSCYANFICVSAVLGNCAHFDRLFLCKNGLPQMIFLICDSPWHGKRDGRVVNKRETIPQSLRDSSLYTREPIEVTRLRDAVRVML